MTALGKGWKKRAAAAALAFSALSLAFLLILGAGEEERLSGVFLCRLPEEDTEVFLFGERDGKAWLVCGGEEGTLLLRLDALTGEVLNRREADIFPEWVSLREGSLYFREDSETGFRLIQYDGETLEELSRREVRTDGGDLLLFDCDSAGTAYFVTSKNRRIVTVSPPDGEEAGREYEERVTFLGTDGDDCLYVYAGEALYTETKEGAEEPFHVPKPMAVLAPGMWIDGEGTVRRLNGHGAEALFRTSEQVYSSRFYCLDGENCLILSIEGGGVRRYGLSGEPEGSCRVEENIRGLCASGALSEKDGRYYYTRLPFCSFPLEPSVSSSLSPDPSPSPSPGLSPGPSSSPSPKPVEEAPAWVEKTFLLTDAGMTAAQLRELLQPNTAVIEDALGNPVIQGKLATGMTVNGWTVVVLGDCDGTGTVTGKDVRDAMFLALGGQEGSPQYRAADLDNDGKIGAGDLVRLSHMAAGESGLF